MIAEHHCQLYVSSSSLYIPGQYNNLNGITIFSQQMPPEIFVLTVAQGENVTGPSVSCELI